MPLFKFGTSVRPISRVSRTRSGASCLSAAGAVCAVEYSEVLWPACSMVDVQPRERALGAADREVEHAALSHELAGLFDGDDRRATAPGVDPGAASREQEHQKKTNQDSHARP